MNTNRRHAGQRCENEYRREAYTPCPLRQYLRRMTVPRHVPEPTSRERSWKKVVRDTSCIRESDRFDHGGGYMPGLIRRMDRREVRSAHEPRVHECVRCILGAALSAIPSDFRKCAGRPEDLETRQGCSETGRNCPDRPLQTPRRSCRSVDGCAASKSVGLGQPCQDILSRMAERRAMSRLPDGGRKRGVTAVLAAPVGKIVIFGTSLHRNCDWPRNSIQLGKLR